MFTLAVRLPVKIGKGQKAEELVVSDTAAILVADAALYDRQPLRITDCSSWSEHEDDAPSSSLSILFFYPWRCTILLIYLVIKDFTMFSPLLC